MEELPELDRNMKITVPVRAVDLPLDIVEHLSKTVRLGIERGHSPGTIACDVHCALTETYHVRRALADKAEDERRAADPTLSF